MELTEPIESINSQLVDLYGRDTVTGLPIWRVVWSEDQFEVRKMWYTDSGIELLSPVVREVPKYRQWVKERFVLERLVVVPEENQDELLGAKISYEPVWAFVDKNNEYLPPRVDASKFLIDLIYAAQGKEAVTVYKDPEAGLSNEQVVEMRRTRIKELENELYGDESSLKGKTHLTGEGVVISNTDFLEKN